MFGRLRLNEKKMKDYSISAWIEPLMDQVEDHITIATREYQNLTEAVLLAPPASGGWSVAQCLEHLNSYGKYYLPAVENALTKVPLTPTTTDQYRSGWFGNYFISMMRPESNKKYKAFKGHIPTSDLDGRAVVAEFIRQQESWLSILRSVTHLAQLNARVPISISPLIRLKLGDVLGFVKAHEERHLQQANRVLAGLPHSHKNLT